MNDLEIRVGGQDQYIAAFGGIICFEFLPDDRVQVSTLNLGSEAIANLEDNLLLLFTWYTRSASELLADQDRRTWSMDQEMIESALRQGTGISMQVRAGVRRPEEVCRVDLRSLGGKLSGAGGGGFLRFYTEEKTRLRRAMRAAGFREVRFRFDFHGTTVVTQS